MHNENRFLNTFRGHNIRPIDCEGDIKDICETCAMEKQVSQSVPKEVEDKAKKVLELVYSDILGPSIVP